MNKDTLVHALMGSHDSIRLIGRSGEFEVDCEDVFYVSLEDARRLPGSWRQFLSEPKNGFVRVKWPEPVRDKGNRKGRLSYFTRKYFEPRRVKPLEADIEPVQRFLIEHPRIDFTRDWRKLWYDIEAERIDNWDKPWESRILSISWKSSNGKSGHLRAKELDDNSEQRILQAFIKIANKHDIILAWNGSRFDDRIFAGRCELLDIPFDSTLYHWLDHLKIFKKYYLRSEDGAVTSSFALDAISEKFLGEEKKVPITSLAIEQGWDQTGDLFTWVWKNSPELLKEYNDQDVDLMVKLEEKTGFIDLHLSLCRLCRVLPGSRSLFPTTLVDGRMLQIGHKKSYHFPTKRYHFNDDGEQAKGAFVPEAVTGLHRSVAVLDYAKMYPSIIRTFNMSLDTICSDGDLKVPDTDEQGKPTGEYVARFKSDHEGHLPSALRGILVARSQYSKMQSEAEVGSPEFHDAARLSTACKVLANTFYGVILSPRSRYYRKEIGESVTSVGRYLLSTTLATTQKHGYKFVFGDTDSVAFVATDEQAQGIKDEMNGEVIPALLEPLGVTSSEIMIDYEKRYDRVVVTASKKYAGKFALYKGKVAGDDVAFDIKGLEIVRSDVSIAARNLQKFIINELLSGSPSSKIWMDVESFRDSHMSGRTDVKDLVLSKAISKDLKDYSSKPPQVRVAEWMKSEGREVGEGTKVPFLFVDGDVIHPDQLESSEDLDRVYYWNKYIYPPSQRVLEKAFPSEQWESLLFPKNFGKDQLDMFISTGPSQKKVRRTRKVPKIIIHVDHESTKVKQLRKMFESFSGDHPVRVDVESPKEVVEMICQQKIQNPQTCSKFGTALRTIGMSWSLE